MTSQLTYVPGNYWDVCDYILKVRPVEVAGVVFIRVLSWRLVGQIVGLYAMGCWRVANVLVGNLFSLMRDRRRRRLQELGIPRFGLKTMGDGEIVEWVKRNGVDLIVNLRTRDIFGSSILAAPAMGCINVHHGLLPRYRGMYCDLYALAEGRPAGFTVHVMDAGLDTGRILLQEVVAQSAKDYVAYLGRAARQEGPALARLLRRIQREGRLPEGEANTATDAVFTRMPTPATIKAFRLAGMQL